MTTHDRSGITTRADGKLRRVLLRACLVLFGLSPLLATELTLRICSYERRPIRYDPFLDLSRLQPLFESTPDGRFQIPASRLRLFAPAEFSVHKEANTRRIFCVGGSTTQGEPYRPPTAFPEWLRLNLELIAPDIDWEVVNCGGLSYATYRMLPIVEEVLDYEPDLIIVECGHNEFLEERELSGWKRVPGVAVRALSYLHSLRVVEYASSKLTGTRDREPDVPKTRLRTEVDALLDNRGGLESYQRGRLDAAAVVASLRWNLREMVAACRQRRVPIVLLVPTANIRDCPPFKVQLPQRLDSDSRAKADALWDTVRVPGQSAEQIESAMTRLLELDPGHAGAAFVLGRGELQRGRIDVARDQLVRAKDNDVCPLRATTEIQAAIRQVAAAADVWSLDVDSLFRSLSDDGLVGDKQLVDHVHPRIEGHQRIGESLAELLLDRGWVSATDDRWVERRPSEYQQHLSSLGEDYFIRGQQRLQGLILWTQGRSSRALRPNSDFL